MGTRCGAPAVQRVPGTAAVQGLAATRPPAVPPACAHPSPASHPPLPSPCRAHPSETKHPEFGTAMRMLKQEVPLRLAAEGDATYSGLLGPLPRDDE